MNSVVFLWTLLCYSLFCFILLVFCMFLLIFIFVLSVLFWCDSWFCFLKKGWKNRKLGGCRVGKDWEGIGKGKYYIFFFYLKKYFCDYNSGMVLREQGLEEKASRLMYERGQKTKGEWVRTASNVKVGEGGRGHVNNLSRVLSLGIQLFSVQGLPSPFQVLSLSS